MHRKILISLSSLALIISFGSFAQIFACTCDTPSICNLYQEKEIIFVGKVTEIEKKADNDYVVTFVISEAFKEVKTGEKIRIRSMQNAGGSCGYFFKNNETYLIFTSKHKSPNGVEKLPYVGQCSGTAPIIYAENSIDFLRKVTTVTTESMIFGNIYEFTQPKTILIEGIKIKAQSIANKNKVYYGLTNQFGNYDVKIPVGRYLVSPELPPSYIFSEIVDPILTNAPVKVEKNKFNGKC